MLGKYNYLVIIFVLNFVRIILNIIGFLRDVEENVNIENILK